MKKVLKFGCGSIAYNNDYIFAGANKIGIIDRKTNNVCGFLSGMRNITSISMDKQYVYAKTTTGIYGAFNLEPQELEYKGYCREKKNTSHDGKIFCIESGVILDLLSLKDENKYAVKYNIFTKSYEKVCLSNSNFHCYSWNVDFQSRKAFYLFVKTRRSKHEKTNCIFKTVNVDSLEIESEIAFDFENGIFPKRLINSHSVLLSNMQIADIYTKERYMLDSVNRFNNPDCGYFVSMSVSSKNNLILVFSNAVFVYDIEKRVLLNRYDCVYGSAANIIDERIYIGTWDGLFVIE